MKTAYIFEKNETLNKISFEERKRYTKQQRKWLVYVESRLACLQKKKKRGRAWHKIVKIGQVMVKFKYVMTSANDPMLRNTLL